MSRPHTSFAASFSAATLTCNEGDFCLRCTTGGKNGKSYPGHWRGGTRRWGRALTEQLLKQGKAVRAMVRNDDERAQALRDMGAEVVVGNLLRLGGQLPERSRQI